MVISKTKYNSKIANAETVVAGQIVELDHALCDVTGVVPSQHIVSVYGKLHVYDNKGSLTEVNVIYKLPRTFSLRIWMPIENTEPAEINITEELI